MIGQLAIGNDDGQKKAHKKWHRLGLEYSSRSESDEVIKTVGMFPTRAAVGNRFVGLDAAWSNRVRAVEPPPSVEKAH